MKKFICVFFSCFLILGLSACGGEISANFKTHTVDSQLYTQDEISDAIEIIKNEFEQSPDWAGCTLTEVYYAGDEVTRANQSFADDNSADQVIILLSSFDVDSSGGDGSLEANSTYKDWKWILVRSNSGQWEHIDHGY